MGGEPDAYYMPTIVTVSNPYLKFNKELKIGKDCIVVPSDKLYLGLMGLHNRYASLLTENTISLRLADINARSRNVISAPDDNTARSARAYLDGLERGELGVIGENGFLEGIKVQDGGQMNDTLTNLIEYHQYTLANWYNALGIEANFNMKREALGANETQQNRAVLLPLIDNMLECRKLGLEQVNSMFGTNITVELASSWKEVTEEPEEESEEEPDENSGHPENEEEEGKEDGKEPDPD